MYSQMGKIVMDVLCPMLQIIVDIAVMFLCIVYAGRKSCLGLSGGVAGVLLL